ncbi:hypothetical protein [Microbacterium sp. zg.Y1084]|uniref:hypothetical protein n=1 Tax=Microbacterium sp. zg.Y1084 TaxID=2969667 RepID=UPI00214AD51C|nr:hypothetical protein [Microbacterium sp. zg.Y1084]MCR2812800.1 hypothetical protein [Microbacterium sp. zg.Y1084]
MEWLWPVLMTVAVAATVWAAQRAGSRRRKVVFLGLAAVAGVVVLCVVGATLSATALATTPMGFFILTLVGTAVTYLVIDVLGRMVLAKRGDAAQAGVQSSGLGATPIAPTPQQSRTLVRRSRSAAVGRLSAYVAAAAAVAVLAGWAIRGVIHLTGSGPSTWLAVGWIVLLSMAFVAMSVLYSASGLVYMLDRDPQTTLDMLNRGEERDFDKREQAIFKSAVWGQTVLCVAIAVWSGIHPPWS